MPVERGEEAIAPVKNVMTAHPGPHTQHTAALLLRLHGQGAVERLRDAELVVGVHQQCSAAQLGSGTGKLAEDQDAIIFRARGTELLGNQVHAVLEGCDKGKARSAIEGQQLLARQRAMDIVDGDPAGLAVIAVDMCHQLFDLVHEPSIGGYALAAGHDDLIERDMAPHRGIVLQEAGEGAQPLRNSFSVVQPVDTDGDADAIELAAYLERTSSDLCACGALGELLEVDTDGKGLKARLT